MKLTHGRSDIEAQRLARNSPRPLSKWLSDDPEVLRLVSEGYDAFVKRTSARILRDCADKLFLNRCPKCNGLARTSTAQQCRFCGHDWHPK
jgi:hypothetical protein